MSVRISRSPVRKSGSLPYLTAVFDRSTFKTIPDGMGLMQVSAKKLPSGDVEIEFTSGPGTNARSRSDYNGGSRFQWPVTGDLALIPITGLSGNIEGHVTSSGSYRIVLTQADLVDFIQRERKVSSETPSTALALAAPAAPLAPAVAATQGATLVAQGSVAEIVAELQRLGVKGSVTAITIQL